LTKLLDRDKAYIKHNAESLTQLEQKRKEIEEMKIKFNFENDEKR
jgi:hypothetical protein